MEAPRNGATPERPQRAALTRALRSAGISWELGVEAHGWELTLRFVELGLGVAVVNGCCRTPSALEARPIQDLPRVPYFRIRRHGSSLTVPAGMLAEAISSRPTVPAPPP